MNLRLLGCCLGAVLLPADRSLAIPQSFTGGGNFALRAGMPFEEFAADKETWSGGTLKGEWSAPGKGGEKILKDEAVVFGLPAAEIKAQRASGGVQRFLITFRDEAGKTARSPLFERVSRNVSAFTGDRGKASGGDTQVFRHAGGILIIVRNKSAQQVEVEFRPGS